MIANDFQRLLAIVEEDYKRKNICYFISFLNKGKIKRDWWF